MPSMKCCMWVLLTHVSPVSLNAKVCMIIYIHMNRKSYNEANIDALYSLSILQTLICYLIMQTALT